MKTLGDEVLFAATEPEVAVEAALVLAAGLGDGFPAVRVGLAGGRVLHRMGDLFGTPVNLASRLTSFARARHGPGRRRDRGRGRCPAGRHRDAADRAVRTRSRRR